MLTTIFKNSTKNLTIASCLILGLSPVVCGQTATELRASTTSTESSLWQSESATQLSQITRPRRSRTRRTRRTRQTRKAYFGLGAGIFLPGEVSLEEEGLSDDASLDYSNGFALSLFGGYKFFKYFAAELDMSLAFGSLEVNNVPDEEIINDLDLDYTAFGIYFNPRFELPLLQDKLRLYAAPGIGYSSVSSDNDTDFDFDGEVDNITSDSGFSYQLKAGAAYAVTNTVSIFGQARYNSFFLEDIDNLEGITLELGATF